METELKTVTLGAGCFWCVEAVFQQLQGVKTVVSGYMGGHIKNPSYREVCEGTTGHAEVTRITYDPLIITFGELLKAFWSSHDPTTLNQQGNDRGTQYRSVIFYGNEEEKVLATELKNKLNESGAFNKPVVTAIAEVDTFYAAEDYHQNYFNKNGDAPYCAFVIRPKLEKFKKAFGSTALLIKNE